MYISNYLDVYFQLPGCIHKNLGRKTYLSLVTVSHQRRHFWASTSRHTGLDAPTAHAIEEEPPKTSTFARAKKKTIFGKSTLGETKKTLQQQPMLLLFVLFVWVVASTKNQICCVKPWPVKPRNLDDFHQFFVDRNKKNNTLLQFGGFI